MSMRVKTLPTPTLTSVAAHRMASVRRVPGMYIGSPDGEGLRSCVEDIVSELVKTKACTRVELALHADGAFTISSNGKGLSAVMDHKEGIAAITILMTQGPSPTDAPRHSLTTAWMLNALSHRFELRTFAQGYCWGQDFVEGGTPLNAFHRIPRTPGKGTSVRCWPNNTILGDNAGACMFDSPRIKSFLQDFSCLHPGVDVITNDQRKKNSIAPKTVHLLANTFADALNAHSQLDASIQKPLLMEKTVRTAAGHVHVRIALRLLESRHYAISTFINDQKTLGYHFGSGSGTHEDGFKSGALLAVNAWNSSQGFSEKFLQTDVIEGLAAAVHVRMKHPHFYGSTKTSLQNPEAGDAVKRVMRHFLTDGISVHPEIMTAWLHNAHRAAHIRSAGLSYNF